MEENRGEQEWDTIIVGLGCVGLSAAYYLTRQGLKVLGLEQYSDTGSIGTASYGHTRIWRLSHDDDRYTSMMTDALEIWKEIEEKSGKKLLTTTGLLWVLDPESECFKKVVSQEGGELIGNAEFKLKYPALKYLPDNLQGFFSYEAGIVKSNESLQVVKELSIEQGADLRFNQTVKNVDSKNGIVELESGERLYAKNVVICCGPVTDKLYKQDEQFQMTKIPMETYVLSDNSDLPSAVVIKDVPEFQGQEVFGLVDGENGQLFKFGHELGAYDSSIMLGIMKQYFPSKYEKILHVQPCFYARTPGLEFIFERDEKAIYAFGLSGKGFKHMPYHGKRIYQIITGDDESANKYKKI